MIPRLQDIGKRIVAQAQRLQPVERVFGLQAASLLMFEICAPWVQELGLLLESFESVRPSTAILDWRPGAVLRLPFSSAARQNRQSLCEASLLALADTAILFALAAACREYRPSITTEHKANFVRTAQCDLLADARIVHLGPTGAASLVSLFGAADRRVIGTITSRRVFT